MPQNEASPTQRDPRVAQIPKARLTKPQPTQVATVAAKRVETRAIPRNLHRARPAARPRSEWPGTRSS